MFGLSRREKVEKAQKQLRMAAEARDHERARLAVERLVALCGMEVVSLDGFLTLSMLLEPGHPVAVEQAAVVSMIASLSSTQAPPDADRALAYHFPGLPPALLKLRGMIGGLMAEDLVVKVGGTGHQLLAEKALGLLKSDSVPVLDALGLGKELAQALLHREDASAAASVLFGLEERLRAALAAGALDGDLALGLISVHNEVCQQSSTVTLSASDFERVRAGAQMPATGALDATQRLRLFAVVIAVFEAVHASHAMYGTAVLQYASYLADAGDDAGAVQQARRALDLLAAGNDTHMLARGELKLAHLLGDAPEALALAHSALGHAEASDAPDAMTTVLRCQALIGAHTEQGRIFVPLS